MYSRVLVSSNPHRKGITIDYPKLIDRPEDIAQFADDMAQLGPFTSHELAAQYLDQNLADDNQDFDEAVEAFEPTCRYFV